MGERAHRRGLRRTLALALIVIAFNPAAHDAVAHETDADTLGQCPVDAADVGLVDHAAIPDVHLDNVRCAAELDIARGFADATYRPHLSVTRAQMASFIFRTLQAAQVQIPEPAEERFSDVGAGAAHDEAIHRLAAAGILQGGPLGLDGNSYGPQLSTRRDQMASFLIRAAGVALEGDPGYFEGGHDAAGGAFPDVPRSNAHFGNVEAANDLHIVRGFGDGLYLPHASTRRDQMASFVVRLLNVVGGDTVVDGLSCGDVVTRDTILSEDMGPCPGHGLIVEADNVVLDLGGHSITGDPGARDDGGPAEGSRDRAGVLFRGTTGSIVTSGTVRGFDAGVAIMGGRNNTARLMTLRDNINYRVITGADSEPGPDTPDCVFGGGLVMVDSSGNTVADNRLTNNGPISGVELAGNSDNNVVRDNDIVDSDVLNLTRDEAPRTTICGIGAEQDQAIRGPEVMGFGIRIEGPGASGNTVHNNTVTRSSTAGIAIAGSRCTEDGAAPADNNGGNQILDNTVTRTGERTVGLQAWADGIAIEGSDWTATVCASHGNAISHNTTTANQRDGLNLGEGAHGNTVISNTADGNARHGIALAGPTSELPGATGNMVQDNDGHDNAAYDGADFTVECGSNDWVDNDFGTVNQDCVQPPPDPPTVVAAWNNSFGNGLDVRWSQWIAQQPLRGAAAYSIFTSADCSGSPVAIGASLFWNLQRPDIRDVAFSGWEFVSLGETYYLHVRSGTERGSTGTPNEQQCVEFVASSFPGM